MISPFCNRTALQVGANSVREPHLLRSSFQGNLDRSSWKIHCTPFPVNSGAVAHFVGASANSPSTLLQERYNCRDIGSTEEIPDTR
jgi:hypothetical protein